tara:strand:- start:377 stop:748 length:372 start_codon:yes stop_codon:yes gene_type:complete
MINHKKVYIDYFNYIEGDIILCEVCKYNTSQPLAFSKDTPILREAVDIHHIIPRGAGGASYNRIRGDSKYPRDYPENLMALCREHHTEAEQSKEFNKRCKIIHLRNIIKMLESEQINNIKWND